MAIQRITFSLTYFFASIVLCAHIQAGNDKPTQDQLRTFRNNILKGTQSAIQEHIRTNPELVDCRDRYDFTPLMWATSSKKTDTMLYLLAAGADPCAETRHWKFHNVLEIAVNSGCTEGMDILLNAMIVKKSSREVISPNALYRLMGIAAENGNIKWAQWFMQQLEDRHGTTGTFDYAIIENALNSKNIDWVSIVAKKTSTGALSKAIENLNQSCCPSLEKFSDAQKKRFIGILKHEYYQPQRSQSFDQETSSRDTPDLCGLTPLMWATQTGNPTTMKHLLQLGANPFKRVKDDNLTRGPLEIAVHKRWFEGTKLLLDAMLKKESDEQVLAYLTALAVKKNDLPMTKLLFYVKDTLGLDSQQDSRSLLDLALLSKNPDLFRFIVKRSTDETLRSVHSELNRHAYWKKCMGGQLAIIENELNERMINEILLSIDTIQDPD